MDKVNVMSTLLSTLHDHLELMPQFPIDVHDICCLDQCRVIYDDCCSRFSTEKLIIKPRAEGCSAGVVWIEHADDLFTYYRSLNDGDGLVFEQKYPVAIPVTSRFMIEPAIQTAAIIREGSHLRFDNTSPWIECVHVESWKHQRDGCITSKRYR